MENCQSKILFGLFVKGNFCIYKATSISFYIDLFGQLFHRNISTHNLSLFLSALGINIFNKKLNFFELFEKKIAEWGSADFAFSQTVKFSGIKLSFILCAKKTRSAIFL